MANIFLFLVALNIFQGTVGYPGGAPLSQCESMIPSHNVKGQSSKSPYQIILSNNQVQGGQKISVRLAGGNLAFKGFLTIGSKVVSGAATTSPPHSGKIVYEKNDKKLQSLACFGHQNSGLTHTDATPKTSIEFEWIAPNENGVFVILTTFVKDYKTFWVRVPSAEIQVTKSANFFPDEEQTEMDNPPNVFDAIIEEMHVKYFAGCGKTKGCFGIPSNCYDGKQAYCDMFTSWRHSSKDEFKFQVVGRLPDWETYEDTEHLTQGHISSGLSHDNLMGSDSVIGCVYKDGKVRPKSYFNLPNTQQNSMFQNESTGLGSSLSGKYAHGFLLCEFTRSVLLLDTTKELGANFDLLKDYLYIILARSSSMGKNEINNREKLGYHGEGPLNKGVSSEALILTKEYEYKGVPSETTEDGSKFGQPEITTPRTKPIAADKPSEKPIKTSDGIQNSISWKMSAIILSISFYYFFVV